MTLGTKIFWATLAIAFIFINSVKGFRKIKHASKIRRARKVYKKINAINNMNQGWLFSYLRKIDPFVFEELILISFRKNGFRIKRNRRYTHDGGIDGRCFKGGEQFLIQAKRYSSYIKEEHMREFIKVCRNKRCRGYFIHTGKTGKETKTLLSQNPQIKIISGEKLHCFFLEKNKNDRSLFF